jgi:Metalloenzyme superfamily
MRRSRFFPLFLVSALWFAFALPPRNARARPAASRPATETTAALAGAATEPPPAPLAGLAVVLLSLDGVRAREIFQGPERDRIRDVPPEEIPDADALAPNLRALAFGRGAVLGMPGRGEPMLASGPRFISLPGYLEIVSGRPSGCYSNGCSTARYDTIIDQIAAMPKINSGEVALFASWPRLAALDPRHSHKVVVSAGRRKRARDDLLRRHPEVERAIDAGAHAKAYPGHGGYRPDRQTADVALAWLSAHRTAFAFVSLGDCDEYAHRGDYMGYLGALAQSDRVIGDVVALLAHRHAAGMKTLLLVTTDHGRGPSFVFHDREEESAHVWLVAAGSLLSRHGVVEARMKHHLADVAPTLREVFGLPADGSRRAGSTLRELIGPSAQLAAR